MTNKDFNVKTTEENENRQKSQINVASEKLKHGFPFYKQLFILIATVFMCVQTTQAVSVSARTPIYVTYDNVRYKVSGSSPNYYVIAYSCDDTASHIVIPETIVWETEENRIDQDGYSHLVQVSYNCPVKSINENCFRGKETIETVTINAQIKTHVYFRDCKNLKRVALPECIETIGDGAFCNCKKLLSVNIPPSVETIGGDAFSGCSCLTDISLSSSLKEIGSKYIFL